MLGGLWSTCSSFAGLSFCSGLGLLGCFFCCLCFLKVRSTGDKGLVAKPRNEDNTSCMGARTFLAFFTGSSGSAEGAAACPLAVTFGSSSSAAMLRLPQPRSLVAFGSGYHSDLGRLASSSCELSTERSQRVDSPLIIWLDPAQYGSPGFWSCAVQ